MSSSGMYESKGYPKISLEYDPSKWYRGAQRCSYFEVPSFVDKCQREVGSVLAFVPGTVAWQRTG